MFTKLNHQFDTSSLYVCCATLCKWLPLDDAVWGLISVIISTHKLFRSHSDYVFFCQFSGHNREYVLMKFSVGCNNFVVITMSHEFHINHDTFRNSRYPESNCKMLIISSLLLAQYFMMTSRQFPSEYSHFAFHTWAVSTNLECDNITSTFIYCQRSS